MNRGTLYRLAACAALLYVVLFWRLGEASFWDPDEAHYAETTREMLATGDWLAPMYNGVPFFDKPVFFHWLQGLSMRALGQTEFAARFAGALSLLLLVGVTAWLGTRAAGPAIGRLAGWLLVINPGVFGLARYAILDPAFTLCLFAGVALLAVAIITNRRRLQWPAYLLIGAATLLKGPLALALCGLTMVVASVASREARRRLLGLHWLAGGLMAGALIVPWLAYMLRRFDQGFIDGYVLNENLRLFAQPLYGNQPGWWFYLSILATGLLPWTGLIVGRAYDQIRNAGRGLGRPDLFDVLLWSWTGSIVAFFSASQFKLDHYVFPVAPALCLIAARGWHEAHNGDPARTAGVRIGARLVGPILVVAGLVMAYLAVARLDLPRLFLAVPVALIVLGVMTTIRRSSPGPVPMPWPAILAFACLYAGVVSAVLPRLEEGKVIPDVARWVDTHAAGGDRIATFRLNRWNPAFRFYVSRPVSMMDSDEEARQFFADSSAFYCVMTRPLYDALIRAGVPLALAYSRDGIWATSGRVLWRARGEPTTFVVAMRSP